MKTLKKVPVKIKDVNQIPDFFVFGILYYSPEFEISGHKCLCGCGHDCYLPTGKGEWNISNNSGKLTVTPSILQRFDCKSHYIIKNGVANFV